MNNMKKKENMKANCRCVYEELFPHGTAWKQTFIYWIFNKKDAEADIVGHKKAKVVFD